MSLAAVEADGLDTAPGVEEQRAARGFVDAAGLHAHEAGLDDVKPPDAVVAAVLVQRGEHRRRGHLLAVDRHL